MPSQPYDLLSVFPLSQNHWQVVNLDVHNIPMKETLSSSTSFTREACISIEKATWSHTHILNLPCTTFRKPSVRSEFPNSFSRAGVIYDQSQLITSLHLGIINLFSGLSPSTCPNPFEVKALVIFVRCKKTFIACALGCSDVHNV